MEHPQIKLLLELPAVRLLRGPHAAMVLGFFYRAFKRQLRVALPEGNTQRVHVRLTSAIDEHFERARQGGAKITMEPADQFYGDRTYMAIDLEGHHWTFSQAVKQVSLAEMEEATGFKFKPLK